MSAGREFLAVVLEKLRGRIRELDETIEYVQKDIEGMHEYYWENYTEMDQYGYENFDNSQALLTQINANQENLNMRRRLKKMLDSPFFGRVDFIYDGDDEAETFHIGIGNFAEKRGGLPLIYDWRAPVSGLFYDYDKGPASYEAPSGRMEGEITSRRQYKIRGGRMIYEFESDMKIDDDILKQELGTNSDTQLKNIVRTIQKEQNAIIRNTKDKILVIQGAAGSGKTSVALHRIAYLLYHDRENLSSSNILVLSPNSVFSDYISHILPELGEENIREMSFDLFAYRELKDTVADCEDRYHQIERQIRDGWKDSLQEPTDRRKSGHQDADTDGSIHEQSKRGALPEEADGDCQAAEARYRWKQSKEFVQCVEGFLVELEDRLVDFRDVEYKGMEKKADEILKLFYYKFSGVPLLSRMDAVMEYFVDEYETLHDKTLPEEELQVIREKFESLYVTTDLYEIYNWLLEDCGYPALREAPIEKRILEYEDVYPLLYLKYRLRTGAARRNIRHLVIDEMQDYSYLQYVILGLLFTCNMTILGDRAQTVDQEPTDVLTFLPDIFGRKIRCIEMKKSYRNTAEIAEYAAKITGVAGIEYFQRHGKAVKERSCLSMEEVLEDVLRLVRLEGTGENGQRKDVRGDKTSAKDARGEGFGAEESHGGNGYADDGFEMGFETAAVLTMTEQEARDAYRYLKESREDVSYIDRDSSLFQKGITVTTFYLAKGLEFDQVFVAGGEKESALFDQFRYICATRALHELYVFDIEI